MNKVNTLATDFIDSLVMHLPSIGYISLIIIISWLLQKYLVRFICKKMIKRYEQKNVPFKKEIVIQFEKPAQNLLLSLGVLYAFSYALDSSLLEYTPMLTIVKTFIFFFLFKAIYNVAHFFGENPKELMAHFNIKSENVLFPLFSRVCKVLIIMAGIVFISYEWGYDINGFVAGLGIGGLALALGAKDILSHIFGGIALALDKPFSIGDWISNADKSIDGVVEDMSFRSTRIRTFDKAIISVPNAVLANETLYNWTRRENRRVRFYLGIPLSTNQEKTERIINRIKETIIAHTGILEDSTIVSFEVYNQISLDILIQYFTKTTELEEFINIKQAINLSIMNILKEEDVSLARPSQDIIIERDNSREPLPI